MILILIIGVIMLHWVNLHDLMMDMWVHWRGMVYMSKWVLKTLGVSAMELSMFHHHSSTFSDNVNHHPLLLGLGHPLEIHFMAVEVIIYLIMIVDVLD